MANLSQDDLDGIAARLQAAAPVNAVAAKIPRFWAGSPEVWFKQAESIFEVSKPPIVGQKTKFNYVLATLDSTVSDKIQSIILNPSPTVPYDELKAALIAAFRKTQAQKDQELLDLNGLGDRKPSELFQHMLNLNADPQSLFKALFLAQLPLEARRVLALSKTTELRALAVEADRIIEVSRLTGDPSVSATGWKDKSRKDSPKRGKGPSAHSPNARSRRPSSPKVCRFHAQYGEAAWRCERPCKFRASENRQTGRK